MMLLAELFYAIRGSGCQCECKTSYSDQQYNTNRKPVLCHVISSKPAVIYACAALTPCVPGIIKPASALVETQYRRPSPYYSMPGHVNPVGDGNAMDKLSDRKEDHNVRGMNAIDIRD